MDEARPGSTLPVRPAPMSRWDARVSESFLAELTRPGCPEGYAKQKEPTHSTVEIASKLPPVVGQEAGKAEGMAWYRQDRYSEDEIDVELVDNEQTKPHSRDHDAVGHDNDRQNKDDGRSGESRTCSKMDNPSTLLASFGSEISISASMVSGRYASSPLQDCRKSTTVPATKDNLPHLPVALSDPRFWGDASRNRRWTGRWDNAEPTWRLQEVGLDEKEAKEADDEEGSAEEEANAKEIFGTPADQNMPTRNHDKMGK
ncbi:unnamed protein product [Protopolystoma xenopodis]|uniref:Uncharacterized protein n=1 Tax=Protopolystoma xenopodis TaxID=117903 RepID=A0A3S5AAU8_9PLAT|nr:unnamed protein product [Protopolystoma xenopodis]